MKYKVIAYCVNGSIRPHYSQAIVSDTDFAPNVAKTLCEKGFLQAIDEPTMQIDKIKIGVVIPTIKGRELFLNNCLRMLANQTLQADYVTVIDYDLKQDFVDLALRYRIGFMECFQFEKCDVVFCIEDDDWYSKDYIQTMVTEWHRHGKPSIFGVGETYYYHIFSQKYLYLKHLNRASMFCTMLTKEVLKVPIDYKDPYLDLHLWKSLRGATFSPLAPIAIGIKHGIGKVGGGAHNEDSKHYQSQDKNFEWLNSKIGFESRFYWILGLSLNYDISTHGYQGEGYSRPIVTILTRKHGNNRPTLFKKHRESLLKLKGKFQQIFIEDKKGLGMLAANSSFQLAVPIIKGDWVYLLDDDDGIIDVDIISKIQHLDCDVVICKAKIGGLIYPPNEVWEMQPQRAKIGGSNIFVKKHIFAQNIIHFSHKQMGDFEFINVLWNKGYKFNFIDTIAMETYKVSRGTKE
jgi:glycosyltransferase involved in cell wall biosynthesis